MTETQTIERNANAKKGEPLLEIEDLHAGIGGKEILKGISLTVRRGEIHAIMGPNGSGKSTLAYLLMGRPGYEITHGAILFKGENVAELSADERAKRGLFLAFQYPQEIPGVSVVNFLRTARNAVHQEMSALAFNKFLKQKIELLEMDPALVRRYVNEGFSGGEKKRNEILQMAVLEPEMAVLDETDSGLDIDALREVSHGVNTVATDTNGILLITHYQRILNYIKPHQVHVLLGGKIVKTGGADLAAELETTGYDSYAKAQEQE